MPFTNVRVGFNRQRNRDNDAEENDETVYDDIDDLAEHTDTHARDLDRPVISPSIKNYIILIGWFRIWRP